MNAVSTQNVSRTPRFMNTNAKVVYDLFDAFVQATLVNDKAIDFSKPVVIKEDGSLEFVTRDEKFSDIISGEFKFLVVKNPTKPTKPRKPKEDADLPTYEAQMAEYQAKMDVYNELAAAAEAKRQELLQEKGLLYAHLNWLWTLGMNNAKTTCGADNLKALGIEKEDGAAFTGKLGLWKASAAGMKKELSYICNVLFRFATISPEIKAYFPTLADVKAALIDLIMKVRSSEKVNARHGLLHLCDPEKYAALYSAEEKIQMVQEHRGLLNGFVDLYNKCEISNHSYYKDEKLGYRFPTTDAQVCFITDVLNPVTE